MSIKALQRKIWSVFREPTEFETKILECLARFGPLNINQIRVKLSCAYSSTRKAIFNLVGKGFVIESGIMIVKHTRLETPTYDLTLKGVFFVLKKRLTMVDAERNDEYIRRIIRKYDSLLPLVFDKWSYFIKMNVEKMAIARLRLVADNIDRSFKKGDLTFPGTNMEEKICWFFYFYGHYPRQIDTDMWAGVADPPAWARAWKQDEEIRAFVVEKLKDEQKRLEKARIFVKDALSSLEGA